MNKLNYMWLTVIRRVKRAWLHPQSVAIAREQRRRSQAVRNEYEFERLDRLRNPSKYLGK